MSATTTRRERAKPMAPDERRQAIIDATGPLLIERGVGLTTREIAEAAGIAEGTIFRVFPDKAALWTAVAEQIFDPEVELAELRAALAGRTDLRESILAVTEHLFARSQRVMAVMMVMRALWMSCPPDQRDGDLRPPRFMTEANRALMAGLAELFEAHRDELAVEPATAATVLRALVLGTRHPGAVADPTLTPETVADVMLDGITRRPRED